MIAALQIVKIPGPRDHSAIPGTPTRRSPAGALLLHGAFLLHRLTARNHWQSPTPARKCLIHGAEMLQPAPVRAL
jgi:hypothetical protein